MRNLVAAWRRARPDDAHNGLRARVTQYKHDENTQWTYPTLTTVFASGIRCVIGPNDANGVLRVCPNSTCVVMHPKIWKHPLSMRKTCTAASVNATYFLNASIAEGFAIIRKASQIVRTYRICHTTWINEFHRLLSHCSCQRRYKTDAFGHIPSY